jgi:hypothetical protein
MSTKKILRLILLALMLWPVSTPVMAQDMGDSGFTLPDFFFSRADQIARANCLNGASNCRPDIMAQIEVERAVSLLAPWFMVALGMFFLLRYMRKREQKKALSRKMAQRRHVPGSVRKQQEEQAAKAAHKAEDDDRFN